MIFNYVSVPQCKRKMSTLLFDTGIQDGGQRNGSGNNILERQVMLSRFNG